MIKNPSCQKLRLLQNFSMTSQLSPIKSQSHYNVQQAPGVYFIFPFIQSVHLHFETLAREGAIQACKKGPNIEWGSRGSRLHAGHFHVHPRIFTTTLQQRCQHLHIQIRTLNLAVFSHRGHYTIWKASIMMVAPGENVCYFFSHPPTHLSWSGKLMFMKYIPHTLLALDCHLGLSNEKYQLVIEGQGKHQGIYSFALCSSPCSGFSTEPKKTTKVISHLRTWSSISTLQCPQNQQDAVTRDLDETPFPPTKDPKLPKIL